MKADFSRISFDAKKHFSQVLLQQGRVTIDADPNEQGAILLHYLRTLARDILGPAAGPSDACGFGLALGSGSPPVLTIGAGRYYVDGILVENDTACDYAHQPDLAPPSTDAVLQRLAVSQGGDDVWLYLDVWERHVSWIEDDSIREPALGGPDTCSRAKVVWQVRGITRPALLANLQARADAVSAQLAGTTDPAQQATLQAQLDRLNNDIAQLNPDEASNGIFDCTAPLDALDTIGASTLTARLDPGPPVQDACTVSPDSRYRGLENQLYRVEVHRASATGVEPTFKWSRDNGSVAARWLNTDGNDLVVSSTRGFDPGVWAEIGDDSNDLSGTPGTLVKVVKVDADRLTIDPLSLPAGGSTTWTASLSNPRVRRWDQAGSDDVALVEGAVPVSAATAPAWLDLEDGLQVQFAAGGTYRTGDYWLIPARVATGSIEWPNTVSSSGAVTWLPLPPEGIEHHYAPLGFLGTSSGQLGIDPCLCTVDPINSCAFQFRQWQRTRAAAAAPAAKAGTPAPAPAPTPTPTPASSPSSSSSPSPALATGAKVDDRKKPGPTPPPPPGGSKSPFRPGGGR
jgi:hypothetical protein